jgi:hypothetical protein
MERRDFLWGLGVAGAAALLPAGSLDAADAPPPMTESRKAYDALLDALREIDRRYLGPERGIGRPQDIFDGHRYLLHQLATAFEMVGEADPERPLFKQIVTPTRKFGGDNPDSLYYLTPIRPDRNYRIRGNIAGATYTSISWELGSADGHYPTGSRAINDTDLKPAADGSYEILIGPDKKPGNWFKLDADAGSLTTRHYFETERCIQLDPLKTIPLAIENLDNPGPAPAPTDQSVAAAIRRVINWVRGWTIDQPPMLQPGRVPSWVSTVPNKFNRPALPAADIGFANRDAAYAMAPFAVAPDQALVIEGRFPKCRFANVMLWNRYIQSFDYLSRRISLNRKQMVFEPDGSFRLAVAHKNPGIPNWLDASGRTSGLVYWRMVLPEGEIPPLKSELVPLASLARH